MQRLVFNAFAAHTAKNGDKRDIDLNAKNSGGLTAFHQACKFGQLEMAEMLLEKCIDRLDIFEFLSHVQDGLKDHYDIKVNIRKKTRQIFY